MSKKIAIGAVVWLVILVLALATAGQPDSTPLTFESHLVSVEALGDNVYERTYFLPDRTAREFVGVTGEFVRQLAIQNPHWAIEGVRYDVEFRHITVRYTVMAGRWTTRP